MNKIITYLFVACITVAVFSSCERKNNLPSLRETFSAKDKIPFGTYVMHKLLGQLFYDNTIRDKKQHFAATWNEISDTGSLYICISRNLFLSAEDRQAMLNYANSGNSLFIACENIDSTFLKALNCDINVSPIGISGFYRAFDYTNVTMSPASYSDLDKYGYYYFRSENAFVKYDSSTTKILGLNDTGMPDFIVVFYGKGRIYLHCEPRVFGNYFLLQKDNYRYLQNVFAFAPQTPEHVFWDDYYHSHNKVYSDSGNGRFDILLQYPPMAWAFCLLVMMLLLYVLFGSKRRQRIIKIIPPNANTTVAFTETIGRLYYQEKNNKNIADKIITYFMERIRNQYFINTSQLDDAFITTLSRKSSVSKDEVQVLFSTIASVQQSEKISDQQLLLLNRQIENFYKNKT